MTEKTNLFNQNLSFGDAQTQPNLITLLKRGDRHGYEKIFQNLNPFDPPDQPLTDLAKFMTSRPDTSDAEIPAGYTYLSQFIAHDISLDSERKTPPWGTINSSAAVNLRIPFLDLETIYGFERSANAEEPSRGDLLATRARLRLGETEGETTGGVTARFSNDLPRPEGSSKAVIVDQRNDENLAIAQTQVSFIKFHNAIVEHLGGADTLAVFEKARRLAIRHYQWIVLNDFLPRIVKKSVLDDVLKYPNKFYFLNPAKPHLPVEFAFAAFRLGHSMVRNSYQWNRIFNNEGSNPRATLDQLAAFTNRGDGLGKHKKLPSAWLIDWNRFYDIDNSSNSLKDKFNFAKKIDTTVAPLLGFLPPREPGFNMKKSLPAIDLYRNRAWELPTGQAIARKMREKIPVEVLEPQKIELLLPENLKKVFSAETPLWFYILAEAEIEAAQNGESQKTLGDVGSRIIAETFVELIKLSPYSILIDEMQTDKEFLGAKAVFGMPELLKFIASKNNRYDELNPIG